MNEWDIVWSALITALAVGAVGVAIWMSRNRHVTYRADGALEDMGRRIDELTLQVVEMKLVLSHYQVGLATLRAQVIRSGETPEWEPSVQVKGVAEEEPLVRIYNLITSNFSLVEMDELAATAGIPPESYSGDERTSRALSLVQYAARHGELEELVAAGRRKRPRVKWPFISISM